MWSHARFSFMNFKVTVCIFTYVKLQMNMPHTNKSAQSRRKKFLANWFTRCQISTSFLGESPKAEEFLSLVAMIAGFSAVCRFIMVLRSEASSPPVKIVWIW